MTADELEAIESALGVVLPVSFRAAMQTYPLDPADPNSQIALHADAKAVIAFNRFLRESFPDDWRAGYSAFGNSPCGDPFFLDLDSESPEVWSWSHETHEASWEAPGFGEWLVTQRSLEAGGEKGDGGN